jgi:hypothetical protein
LVRNARPATTEGEVGATATVTDLVEKPLMADELAEKPITASFIPEELGYAVVGDEAEEEYVSDPNDVVQGCRQQQ